MANCNNQCDSCQTAGECSEQDKAAAEKARRNTEKVRHVIGVVGGKGGVGKSLVTGLLAVQAQRLGYRSAILDADITGPSIPKMFGIHTYAQTQDDCLLPTVSTDGIKIMSLNLLLEQETDPVFWRGPVISGVVRQFWEETIWGDVDYMFVDMPPGTGDVPLTVFQTLPLDGIIVVSTPQSLVSMIVQKAVNMAQKMAIPVLGMVENMYYLKCPDCGREIELFGKSEQVTGVPVLEKIPLDSTLATACDAGQISNVDVPYLKSTVEMLAGFDA